jgi:hypothetical protein
MQHPIKGSVNSSELMLGVAAQGCHISLDSLPVFHLLLLDLV